MVTAPCFPEKNASQLPGRVGEHVGQTARLLTPVRHRADAQGPSAQVCPHLTFLCSRATLSGK